MIATASSRVYIMTNEDALNKAIASYWRNRVSKSLDRLAIDIACVGSDTVREQLNANIAPASRRVRGARVGTVGVSGK